MWYIICVLNAILNDVLSSFWHRDSNWNENNVHSIVLIILIFVISTSFLCFPSLTFLLSAPPTPTHPFFLRAISLEPCSSGCTPQPTKPINTVYVIDPSACLVYTVCARLCPKETLTFHMQGRPPSLSRIIVQLKSQLEPIMWEGLAEDSWRKKNKKKKHSVWVVMIRVKRDVSLSYSLLYSFIALGERLMYIFKEPFVGDGGCNV